MLIIQDIIDEFGDKMAADLGLPSIGQPKDAAHADADVLAAVAAGMDEKSAEFLERGGQIYLEDDASVQHS